MRLDDLPGPACAFCGADIEHLRAGTLYCSPRCRQRDRTRLEQEARAESLAGRACGQCGGPIPATRRAEAVYCSKGCSSRASHERWRVRVRDEAKAGRTCERCAESIPAGLRLGARYCGATCRTAAESQRRTEALRLWWAARR